MENGSRHKKGRGENNLCGCHPAFVWRKEKREEKLAQEMGAEIMLREFCGFPFQPVVPLYASLSSVFALCYYRKYDVKHGQV